MQQKLKIPSIFWQGPLYSTVLGRALKVTIINTDVYTYLYTLKGTIVCEYYFFLVICASIYTLFFATGGKNATLSTLKFSYVDNRLKRKLMSKNANFKSITTKNHANICPLKKICSLGYIIPCMFERWGFSWTWCALFGVVCSPAQTLAAWPRPVSGHLSPRHQEREMLNLISF